MPMIPARFGVQFGDVFPFGAFVLGVERSMKFTADPGAPKRQERDKETDANEEAARFGAEFKVKIAAPQQPVPPAKQNGFPYAAVEFRELDHHPVRQQQGPYRALVPGDRDARTRRPCCGQAGGE